MAEGDIDVTVHHPVDEDSESGWTMLFQLDLILLGLLPVTSEGIVEEWGA